METLYYPFEISKIYSFMDYETIIAKIFGFNSEEFGNRMTIPTGNVKKFKLTRAERKVLVGLVEYPEESDTLIAEKIGVSRNTVANAKRKFLKKEIAFPRVVPNLNKLGLKCLSFRYYKFSSRIPPRYNWYSLNKNKEFIPTFTKKIFEQITHLY